jgi:hypothetical protein
MTICNSLYFYTHYIGQVAQVAKDAIHYTYNHTLMQLITTQLQFCHNNFFNYYATLLRLQP